MPKTHEMERRQFGRSYARSKQIQLGKSYGDWRRQNENGTHAGFWKGETKLVKSTGVIIGALQVKHISGQDAWVDG